MLLGLPDKDHAMQESEDESMDLLYPGKVYNTCKSQTLIFPS